MRGLFEYGVILLDMKELLAKLEADRADEVKAIAQYDDHIVQTDNEEIKQKLIEIRDEEKHHLQELTVLINKFGGKAYQLLSRLGG